MSTEILQRLEEIKSLSCDIEQLIEHEQWDDLRELTERRQQDLEIIFNTPIEEQHRQTVTNIIRDILEQDKVHRSVIIESKAQVSSNVVDIRKKFKAANKYRQVNALR